MKKVLPLLFTAILTLSILTATATAADYQLSADTLRALGLFRGSNTGDELERPPTRIEAAVMLVRLLGEEHTALNMYPSHPYSDVPQWADGYISYLYEKNIVKGVTTQLFGAGETCTAQMFVTFALRALGYTDGNNADFQYDKALDYAHSIGIYDSYIDSGSFLRGDMTAISFLTLAATPKNYTSTLLDKLVADGAVDKDKTSVLSEKFTNYKAVTEALIAAVNMTAYSFRYSDKVYMRIESNQVEDERVRTVHLKYQDEKLEYSNVLNSDYEVYESYYKDGIYYLNVDNERIKMEISDVEAYQLLKSNSYDSDTVHIINSISKRKTANGTEYTAIPSEAETKVILADILGDGYEANYPGIAVSDITITYLLDNDAKLKRQTTDILFTMSTWIDGQKYPVYCEARNIIELLSSGSNVTISFPSNLYLYTPV